MLTHPGGLGDLLHQPAYARKASRAAHYARFYRSIIFSITLAILLLTLWHHRTEPPPVILALLTTMVFYIGEFAARMYLGMHRPTLVFHPLARLFRCQSGVIMVSLLLGILAAHGIHDSGLWPLYILATLTLSEGLSTEMVLMTLVEVAAFYVGALYIGTSLFEGYWSPLVSFILKSFPIVSNILWIWLMNFVLHYFVRNVQARDEAYRQHQEWLALVDEKGMASNHPEEQHAVVIKGAAKLTGARAELWLPPVVGDGLYNTRGEAASEHVHITAEKGLPAVVVRKRTGVSGLLQRVDRFRAQDPSVEAGGLWLLTGPPQDPSISTQIFVPVFRFEGSEELLGVLELSYPGHPLSDYELQLQNARLQDFVQHVRTVLATSAQTERQLRVNRMVANLRDASDLKTVAQQVVEAVVDQLGFDFATVSIVDKALDTVRCIAGKNADWAGDPANMHDLAADDVQCIVIATRQPHLNDGHLEDCLDRRIWGKYRHHQVSRVWVPIQQSAVPGGLDPVVGTIEAGFHHHRSKTIPPSLVALLESYAEHVYWGMLNGWRHDRREVLVQALTDLNKVSWKMQQAAALYEPNEMARLIGESAEKLLKADIVTLHTYHLTSDRTQLVYITPVLDIPEHLLRDTPLRASVREKLLRERKPYFSTRASVDPILVNLKEAGKPDPSKRTFTQRQKIRSFAGLPLIGKSGDIIGFLCINYRELHDFYEEECEVLQLFAELAAVALEETYQLNHLRAVVIAQERTGLAAELHHSLSQNLWALHNSANAALVYVERSELDRARSLIKGLLGTLEISMYDTERLLNELRELPNSQTDFVTEIDEHVKHLSSQANVHIDFRPDVRGEMPQQVQFYLVRIAREALSNAAKYAPGADVRISYKVDSNGAVLMEIEDNGPGFNLDEANNSRRHGMATMRYFAYRINSYLDITSQPGCTKIVIRVNPIPKENGHGTQPQATAHRLSG